MRSSSVVAFPSPAPRGRVGAVRFVAERELPELLAEADREGLLPVLVPPPAASERGRLALLIEDAVESALERRGACAPGIGAASNLDASLSDQLYRARLLELRGLVLHLGSLDAATNHAGALDAEDSAVLRWWLEVPASRPVELYLDPSNAELGVYGPPLLLSEWLSGEPRPAETIPCVSPEFAASSASMELSSPPPMVELDELPKVAPSAELAGDLAAALVAQLTERGDSSPPPPELDAESAPISESLAIVESIVAEALGPEALAADADVTPVSSAVESSEELVRTPVRMPTPPPPPAASERRPARVEPSLGPLHADAVDQWPHWLKELEEARGPRPLAAVERMFVTSYVPLRDAYLRGIAPGEVGVALDAWAQSFAKSYKDAFEALKVRGKRPTMVLDVPDVALRIGRLHGARSVQLLLVDGMRFDLGLRVEHVLRRRFGQEAALTERLLLWSALPTDTPTQLELIGRGPDGLRQLGSAPESEVPVARGRMASTPRRIKTGHRELLKLDLVEARLAEPGEAEAERLDHLAVDVASAIEELAAKLPNRTLLMVFGDHGFQLDPLDEGTSRSRAGGSTPEEVLVPAFAWLVGGLH